MSETTPFLPALLCCGGLLCFGVLMAVSLFILKHGCNLLLTVLGNTFVTILLLMGLIVALYVNGFEAACEIPLLGDPVCTRVDTHLMAEESQP